jgi:hypothetical protein
MRTFLAMVGLALIAACTATPEPKAPDGLLAPAALRTDFDALYDRLRAAHYDLYAHTDRATMDRLHRSMRAEIDRPMSGAEAVVFFQRFAAAGHVAHARLDFPEQAYAAYREAGGKVFPLDVRVDDARIFITGNFSGDEHVSPGDEILALNGVAAEEWVTRLRAHISADTDRLAYAQLDQLFARLLWLELGGVASFTLNVRTDDGDVRSLALPARTRTEMRTEAEMAPATLSIDPTQREARMLEGGVAYLRPGIFLNYPSDNLYDTAAFHTFIDDAFMRFIAADARVLLIDLRDNPGGDNSFSDHMIAWFADEPFRFTSDFRIRVSEQSTASNAARLQQGDGNSISAQLASLYAGASAGDIVHFDIPIVQPRERQRFTGRVYALINRRSYSNTVSVAAIIQDYGFGTIIGEPTADLATTYGAMEQFTLANTGFVVGYPKAYILRPNGDARVAGVVPNIAIETPIVQGADDPVLQVALRIVRN